MHKFTGETGVSWRVQILPLLEETILYDRIGPTASGGANSWVPQSEMPSLFRCPSAEDSGIGVSGVLQVSNYWGVGGASWDETLVLAKAVCGDLDSNGVLYPGSETRIAEITDGTSHTMAIGERTYSFRAWMTGATWNARPGQPPGRICAEASKNIRYPINASHERWGYFVGDNIAPADAKREMLLNDLFFASDHPGGAHFAFADGSVHFLPEGIDFTIYEDLATIAGGEVTRWNP